MVHPFKKSKFYHQSGPNRVGTLVERQLESHILAFKAEASAKSVKELDITSLLQYVGNKDQSFKRKKRFVQEQHIQEAINSIFSKESNTENNIPSSPEINVEDTDLGFDVELEAETKNNNKMNKGITSLWGIQPSTTTTEKADGQTAPTGKKVRRKANSGSNEANGSASFGKTSSALTIPTVTLSDLGGIENCIEEILELIAMPMAHPEIYSHTGIQPPRGVLLHGPPGCGKTLLAHAIAGELKVPFLQVAAPSVVSGMSGESEKKLREIFDEAKRLAPSLLFLDEIDAIAPKRETAQREMERRIVAQMLTCLDDLAWEKNDSKPVIVIGATNRPDALDPALRRAGRFDREISIGVPDESARERILKVLCSKLRLSEDLDLGLLARRTPGYVGADLNALTSAAGMIAVKRIFSMLKEGILPAIQDKDMIPALEAEDVNVDTEEVSKEQDLDSESAPATIQVDSLEIDQIIDIEKSEEPVEDSSTKETLHNDFASSKVDSVKKNIDDPISTIQRFLTSYPEQLTAEQLAPLAIGFDDFLEALGKVQPSSKREGFATVPDVSWDDIGALSHVRDELRMAVVEPMVHPELFKQAGVAAPAGVLLWGPPGCGKTLLAKAVAGEAASNFISVKGPELLNKYVGESERAVRQVFQRARASQPCVIFFDELDALCSRRDENQSEVSARVVNTLLTELDGLESRKQVFLIAATNRPDIIDAAMLRPGRLDKMLYIELPTPSERLDILQAVSRRSPLSSDIDLKKVAYDKRCHGFSGADLSSLVREAAVTALREKLKLSRENGFSSALLETPLIIDNQHFETALSKTTPSVTPSDLAMFEKLKVKFGRN